MGVIEGGLIAAGLSATTASAVTTGLITTAVGATVAAATAPGAPKIDVPKPLGQADKPQAKQEVDRNAILKRNGNASMGALSGNASTLLSGTGGVASSVLNLGSSSLLGQ